MSGTPSPHRRGRVRAARALMGIAAVAAGLATVAAIPAVLDARSDTRVVEAWRAYGLVVFAGLFALLALRPHAYRGVWELVIFHKVALTVTALVFAARGTATDTTTVLVSDGALSVLLVTAYVLCRGWRDPWTHGSTRRPRRDRPTAPRWWLTDGQVRWLLGSGFRWRQVSFEGDSFLLAAVEGDLLVAQVPIESDGFRLRRPGLQAHPCVTAIASGVLEHGEHGPGVSLSAVRRRGPHALDLPDGRARTPESPTSHYSPAVVEQDDEGIGWRVELLGFASAVTSTSPYRPGARTRPPDP